MSYEYLNWAWSLDLKPGPKIVLVYLADRADHKGICFPKQSTIAKSTGLSRETVNRHLKQLEKLGYLKQIEQRYRDGRRRSSTYQLLANEDFLQSDILSHGKISHLKVINHHNRIPHRDPSLNIGGVH